MHNNITQPQMFYAGGLLQRPSRVPWRGIDILAIVMMFCVVGLPLTLLLGAVAGVLIPVTQPSRMALLFLILACGIYGALGLSVYWWTVRRYHLSWAMLYFRRGRPLVYLAMAPLLVLVEIVGGAINLGIADLFTHGKISNSQIDSLEQHYHFSWSNYFLLLLVFSVVAPLVEEAFFRGVVYQFLRDRWGVGSGVLSSAAVFALAHLLPPLFPELFFLGIVLALVFERTRSIYATVVLHSLNNGLVLTIVFFTLLPGHPG